MHFRLFQGEILEDSLEERGGTGVQYLATVWDTRPWMFWAQLSKRVSSWEILKLKPER